MVRVTKIINNVVIKRPGDRLNRQMNTQEFQIQVYPLKNKLFRFAKRILDQTEEAEDVVQEVFIRLWNRRDTLAEYRSIEALAMITTKNMCLDRIRKKKYPVENFDDHRGFLENIPMETKADYSEEIYRIRQAMEELPDQQKMIVHLRDVEGYEFEDIAAIMDMHENAIRVNLSRARKKLREALTDRRIYEYQRN
jgi:RNA polymerase sigma factor (sigma-70 family)